MGSPHSAARTQQCIQYVADATYSLNSADGDAFLSIGTSSFGQT